MIDYLESVRKRVVATIVEVRFLLYDSAYSGVAVQFYPDGVVEAHCWNMRVAEYDGRAVHGEVWDDATGNLMVECSRIADQETDNEIPADDLGRVAAVGQLRAYIEMARRLLTEAART